MNFISLFSGIGGIDLGLERAGMTCVGQVENDPWCNQILEKHWPTIPRWQDIHDLDPEELPDHDLIAGGFPCQPVSLAGARLAQDDPRWLWPEFFRVVRVVRPRYVVVENVPGVASARMGDVLGDLAQIGYDCEWQSIPAAFVGAPHLRWRIFIVAYPNTMGIRRGRSNTGSNSDGRFSGGSGGDGADVRETSTGPMADHALTDVAHSNGDSEPGRTVDAGPRSRELVLADTGGEGLEREGLPGPARNGDWWAVEPDMGRVAHGVPRRVDRLRGLGNAVVPQVAELVGRMIMESQR